MGKPCSKILKNPESKPKNPPRVPNRATAVKDLRDHENLTFLISLENLKAKNFSHVDIQIIFNFADFYRTFTIIPVSKSDNPHFKFAEDFEFRTTRSGLKSLSAVLSIRDSDKRDLVSIRLNLYELATGPFHHDMILQNKSSSFKGRLLFDLRMRQKTQFGVRPLFVHATLNDPLKEKAYNFFLRIITSEGELNSEHSENVFNQFFMGKGEKVPIEDFQEENENYEVTMNEMMDLSNQRVHLSRFISTNEKKTDRSRHPFSMKKISSRYVPKSPPDSPRLMKNLSSFSQAGGKSKLRTQAISEKHKRELMWNYRDPRKQEFPSLETEICVNEFSLNSLHFVIWGTNNPEEHSNNFSEEESSKKDEEVKNRSVDIHFVDLKMIGECYWSFNKLFREDFHAYETNENEQYVISKHEKVFREKLWSHGAVVGEIEAHFHIELNPFLRQMIGRVRTESGIKEVTSLISRNHKIVENLEYSSKLKVLFGHKETLIISVLRLLDQSTKIKSQLKEKFQTDVFQNIKKLKDLLIQEPSFVYKNEEELLQSQQIFIDLANHIMNYSDEMDEKIRELYYDILAIVCNREELSLHSMGFEQSNFEYLLNVGSKTSFRGGEGKTKNEVKLLALKMKVGLSYQNFLYHTLIKVLSKFDQKALNEKERHFIENFAAQAYFTIPEFRIHFLEFFNEKAKNQPPLYEPVGLNQKAMGGGIYDWEKHFHKFMRTSPKGVKHLQDFHKFLCDFDIKSEISSRDSLFLTFLVEWVQHVFQKMVSKYHIPWNEIPGYAVLVNALLLEMKSKPVSHYSTGLKEASKHLLLNEKLLNLYVLITYKNTRVYDSIATFQTFEIVDTWLDFLSRQKKAIHPIFDYAFFFKGIKLVMEQEHALCIAKCLNMIYNNYQLFPQAFKKELCGYLFSGMFFKLFMHWHLGVRLVFHHFLIYRIHHLHRNMKTELTKIGELYMELMKPHDYHLKNRIINDVIFVKYSDLMKIVEDAKNGLELEFEAVFYDIDPLDSLRLKLNKSKQGPRLEFLKRAHKSSSPFNSFNIGKKTVVLENSMLESERETIKSAFLLKKDEIHCRSLGNLVDIDRELSFKESDADAGSRTYLTQKEIGNDISPLKLTKKGKIYINRRNLFYDNDEEKYLQIPKEYLKYLPMAYHEFEKLKKKYWDWFLTQKAKLSKLPEEEMKKMMYSRPVPTVKINIMVDETERLGQENEGW